MQPNKKVFDAYSNAQKVTMSGREIEANVLTKAANLLKHCQENWDEPEKNGELNEALKFNQKVWSIFQAELSDEKNPLPLEIRQNILSLSIFIDKRIFDIMAYPAPEKLDIIIKINLNIAEGLRGNI